MYIVLGEDNHIIQFSSLKKLLKHMNEIWDERSSFYTEKEDIKNINEGLFEYNDSSYILAKLPNKKELLTSHQKYDSIKFGIHTDCPYCKKDVYAFVKAFYDIDFENINPINSEEPPHCQWANDALTKCPECGSSFIIKDCNLF